MTRVARTLLTAGFVHGATEGFFIAEESEFEVVEGEKAKAQAAYKPAAWNTVRIVCQGPVVQTFLNGVQVSELLDAGESKGIIGLQVHGVGNNETPMNIKWRNLKIKELASKDTAPLLDALTDTMDAVAPRGADLLLASGTGLKNWQLRPEKVPWMDAYVPEKLQWTIDEESGVATPLPKAGSMDSKKNYGKQRIHVEFRTPPMAEGERAEASGNSGIYMQGRYELQICNSFGLDPADNLCGGIYKRRAPDVNAAKKPGEWQTYDVVFTPAQYEGDKKTASARLSAKLNGQWIHRDVEVEGSTGSGDKELPTPGPLRLQEHQHKVQFRNVWVSDLDNPVALKSYDPRQKNQVR